MGVDIGRQARRWLEEALVARELRRGECDDPTIPLLLGIPANRHEFSSGLMSGLFGASFCNMRIAQRVADAVAVTFSRKVPEDLSQCTFDTGVRGVSSCCRWRQARARHRGAVLACR